VSTWSVVVQLSEHTKKQDSFGACGKFFERDQFYETIKITTYLLTSILHWNNCQEVQYLMWIRYLVAPASKAIVRTTALEMHDLWAQSFEGAISHTATLHLAALQPVTRNDI
jgi:hypothetical protein